MHWARPAAALPPAGSIPIDCGGDPGAIPLLGAAALLDVVVMRRALAGRAPGVVQVCEAATP